jgi:hypothetical protein
MAMRSFEVEVSRIMVRRIGEVASIFVGAESEDEAKKEAERKAEMTLGNEAVGIEWKANPDSFEVDIEEIKVLGVREEPQILRDKVAALLKEYSPEDVAAAVVELRKVRFDDAVKEWRLSTRDC